MTGLGIVRFFRCASYSNDFMLGAGVIIIIYLLAADPFTEAGFAKPKLPPSIIEVEPARPTFVNLLRAPAVIFWV